RPIEKSKVVGHHGGGLQPELLSLRLPPCPMFLWDREGTKGGSSTITQTLFAAERLSTALPLFKIWSAAAERRQEIDVGMERLVVCRPSLAREFIPACSKSLPSPPPGI